jgi:nitroreductase
MDAFLAVVSKREVRDYDAEPLPDAAVRRILEAGRVAGSSRNRQARRFVVLDDRVLVERAAQTVHTPSNLLGAKLVVAIVVAARGPGGFDAGRAAQNMMLAAWNDGIGSCPNGIADPDTLRELVGVEEGEQIATVLTFGYPRRRADPARRSAQEWIERADRRPFDDVVSRR